MGAVLFLPLAVATAHAQTPTQDKVEVLPPVQTELVRIDVVVTDKKGQPVPGLTASDFAVDEDGRPQKIAQFEGASPAGNVTTRETAEEEKKGGAAEETDEPATRHGRYIVLAVDDLHIEAVNLLPAKKAMLKFVAERVGSEDQIALVTTSGSLGLYQQFTNDPHVLQRAISRLTLQKRSAEWTGPPDISEYQAELIDRGDPDALSLAVQELMQSGINPDQSSAESEAKNRARAILLESVHTSRMTLETLDGVIRSLGELPGRKVIVLVSDGFLAGLTTSASQGFDIRRITDAGTRSGVVVYALDTRGLIATPFMGDASARVIPTVSTMMVRGTMQRASENALRDAMNALAADTGGFLVHSANDLGAGLGRIMQDSETYYLLAYEPTNSARDGLFRKIEVRVAGRRDLKVRTRKGYFAPDDRKVPRSEATQASNPTPDRRELDLQKALGSLVPLTGIPVQLSADFVSLGKTESQLVVSGHVEMGAVPFEQTRDRRVATVEAVGVIYDESGHVAANFQSERAAMELTPATYEETIRTGLAYQKVASLRPGLYQVRLAIRDEGSGKLGSASQWVQVPDLKEGKLTLSSLFFLSAEPVAGPGGATSVRDVQAHRRFKRDETLRVQFYTYNPKRDGPGSTRLVLQTQVFQRGKLVSASAAEPVTLGERDAPPAPHTTRLKLEPFTPGDYELRVLVTDQLGGETAFRRTGFTIE